MAINIDIQCNQNLETLLSGSGSSWTSISQGLLFLHSSTNLVLQAAAPVTPQP